MNLLVTNTRVGQAYFIIRALRPYARKIVVTTYGEDRFAKWKSHAAYSHLVDKRYHVPSPVEDWRAGKIQRENTEREKAYIQAVMRICETEEIDTIFPSWDPQVYVFAKNKERFEKMGVLIPTPDYETVITPLDKYRTIRAAQEVGFPCPKTFLPESEDDLRRIAEEVCFPLIIRPRFSSGARGNKVVTNFRELLNEREAVKKNHGTPMIQEFIPGKEKQQFYLMIDKKGDCKVAFCPKTHRIYLRYPLNASTACECVVPNPYLTGATKLAQKLGWWGGITLQTKIDFRDGVPKLMEMNPRLGYHLWFRTELGINEPLMCLKIAQGEDVRAIAEYPFGTMLLSPVEDVFGLGFWILDQAFYKFRTGILRKEPTDHFNAPMSAKEMLKSFKETYFNGNEKVFDPHFRYFFQDPGVCALWWAKYFVHILQTTKHLGE
jgi:biotin carboxylase